MAHFKANLKDHPDDGEVILSCGHTLPPWTTYHQPGDYDLGWFIWTTKAMDELEKVKWLVWCANCDRLPWGRRVFPKVDLWNGDSQQPAHFLGDAYAVDNSEAKESGMVLCAEERPVGQGDPVHQDGTRNSASQEGGRE